LEALLPARGQKQKRRPQIYGWKLKKERDFFSVKGTPMLGEVEMLWSVLAYIRRRIIKEK
jgi:hypothetical protein